MSRILFVLLFAATVWSQQHGSSFILIVDMNHAGFHMTDPKKACVTFNLAGTPQRFSWPEHGSGNTWLVYDRDGMIDSGKQLFGNFTPHGDADGRNTKDPNGFLALEWYDRYAQGGAA